MALAKPSVVEDTQEATQAGADAVSAAAEETTAAVEETTAVADQVETADTSVDEAEEARSEEPQRTEVAVRSETASAVSVTERNQQNSKNFTAEMAEDGFEGLDLNAFSFDRIKLHEGQFKHGSDERELGTSFQCIPQQTRRMYIVRQSKDQDADNYYSYDPNGDTLTDGSSADEKQQEWIEDGYDRAQWEIKEYLEAMVMLVNLPEGLEDLNEQMVMLSIPPASRTRMSGTLAQARARRVQPTEALIQCSVGAKVGDGSTAFRPWNFKFLGRIGG